MLQVTTQISESHREQTLVAVVKLNILVYAKIFTQESGLASLNCDMNRVLAVQKEQNFSRLIQR